MCPVNQLKQKSKMKKIFTLVAVASISALVACGPSAEQKAAAEKAKQDSITAADAAAKAAADAAAKASQDSTAAYTAAQEAKTKAMNDSIAAAEDAKKGKGKMTSKPKEAPKKTEVKAGQGKG